MLFYETHYAPWPARRQWTAILLAASTRVGLPRAHTLLCHLAQQAISAHRMEPAAARALVRWRAAVHLEQLALEVGIAPGAALAIAQQAHAWLESLQETRDGFATQPYWPSRTEWLAIDRAAAAQIGLDGNYTLTTNIANIVAPLRRTSVVEAKRWVHGRIAIHASEFARELGYGAIASLVIWARVNHWLNSFE